MEINITQHQKIIFMIHYKKIKLSVIAGAVFALALPSCTKNFVTINTPWNGSPTANVQQLYDGFVSNMQLGGDLTPYNGWIYPITQQGAVYTKSDFAYGSDGSSDWSNFYHNLSNYNELIGLIGKNPDSANYTNLIAMVKTLKAYQAMKLTNFYGDMPYSDAGKAIYYGSDNYKPTYDKQQAVYLACLTDLKWAVDNFNATDTKQYSLGNAELVLLNNIPQWIEFANSLRLRIAVTMYDKDQTDAAPVITEALSKPLLDADTTNVGLWPGNIPNMNLDARSYSYGTECRLRMGTTMWEWMSNTNAQNGSGIFDPRCKIYFEPNNDSLWNPFPQSPTTSTPAEGGDPYNQGNRDADWANKNGNNGTVNLYADYNYFWTKDRYIPDLFMTASEVHFLKAEIYARGIGVSTNVTTAQTEYNAGVTGSVNFWTTMAINSPQWIINKPTGLPDATTMNAFLANPVVAFDVADADHALKQIYGQEWIDMFRQPWEAWTLMKRTGATPMDSTNAAGYTQTYGNYQRYQYPGSEQTYNFANWQAETGGQDLISTKIWIAK
jgi:hypothetical protein